MSFRGSSFLCFKNDIIEDMDIWGLVFVVVITLFSMVLHEMAHGYVAYWLGDQTAKLSGRLSLNPLNHIDPVMTIVVPVLLYLMGGPIFGGAKPVPINTRNLKWREWGMALVGIAGPFTNLILALIFFLLGYFTAGNFTGIWGEACIIGVNVNLGFMLFNMIPIPPLDGSRLLYALAPDFVRGMMENIERFGTTFVFILVLLFGSLLSGYLIGGRLWFVTIFYHMVGA